MSALETCLQESSVETRELCVCDTVPTICEPPTSFEFYKNWVAPNLPFVLKNGVSHWPAVQKWSSDYFRSKFPDKDVSVAITPSGYADAICDGKFVMPEEKPIKFSTFLDILDGKTKETDVYYIQRQNSNMTTDFKDLLSDIESDIKWATGAFGAKPDAINFWMGQERAVTSMHKDHYENLYAVISGEKEFILHPPMDRPFIRHAICSQAKYRKTGGQWIVEDVPDAIPIPWVCVDPANPDFEIYPEYRQAKMLRCSVTAGDLLYLPSLWFHHVSQTDRTIAVNFWYDMEFDLKYSFFRTLDNLSTAILER